MKNHWAFEIVFLVLFASAALLIGYEFYEYSEALKKIEMSKDSTIVKLRQQNDSLKQISK